MSLFHKISWLPFFNKWLPRTMTCQLHDLWHSYSLHLCSNNQSLTSIVYIVKEAPYLELSTLERQQPWNVTCFIPTSSTNVSITYTMITIIETQPHLIRVMISKTLQEFYNQTYIEWERASQTIPNFVTKFSVTQHIQILKFWLFWTLNSQYKYSSYVLLPLPGVMGC